jgi:hypothetical protein
MCSDWCRVTTTYTPIRVAPDRFKFVCSHYIFYVTVTRGHFPGCTGLQYQSNARTAFQNTRLYSCSTRSPLPAVRMTTAKPHITHKTTKAYRIKTNYSPPSEEAHRVQTLTKQQQSKPQPKHSLFRNAQSNSQARNPPASPQPPRRSSQQR